MAQGASQATRASLKREKAYAGVILFLFLIAFGITFKPMRLLPKEDFHDGYFSYRYEKPFGPGERAKEQIRAELQDRLHEKDIAPDSRVTFPTTTEIKVRVPLDETSEAADVDRSLQELLAEVVPEQFGEQVDHKVDLSDFPAEPLFTLGPFGVYRPTLHLKLGLDLQGGVHLVLKARTQNVEFEYRLADTAEQLIAALDAADVADGVEAGEGDTEPAADAATADAEPTDDATTDAEPAADTATGDAEPAADTTTADTVTGDAEPVADTATGDAEPVADTATGDAEPVTDDTSPDGGRPLRMAQLPDEDAPDEDEVFEELEEVEVSTEEAQLLADEELRQRVVERIARLTTVLRRIYGERIGEVHGEVVGSNIAVFRTFVDPKATNRAELRDGHRNILLGELREIFPEVKEKFDEPQDIPLPSDAMRQVKDVITRRIDRLGVSEAEVRTHGADRVVIELPGIKDPDEAVELIGTTARLEFRKVPSTYRPEVETIGAGEETYFVLKSTNERVSTSLVYYEAPEFEGDKNVLIGADLKSGAAQVSFDQQQRPAVSLTIRSRGAKRFDRFAQDNYREYLAVYLDREVISAPEMQARSFGGQVQIRGGFDTVQEANGLAILLNAGALPVPVDVVEQRTVSATLGANSVRQSYVASVFGLTLILIGMAALYRMPGLLADVALVGYILLVLSFLVMFQATLTLPGILGLILSIGMAVDANVIVFERLKEELRESTTRSISAAIRNLYEKATTAIVDGNVTTLLVASVLFFIGTGPIRGFAVTLMIGILCSMFTALVVTRRFQNLLASSALGANRRIYRS